MLAGVSAVWPEIGLQVAGLIGASAEVRNVADRVLIQWLRCMDLVRCERAVPAGPAVHAVHPARSCRTGHPVDPGTSFRVIVMSSKTALKDRRLRFEVIPCIVRARTRGFSGAA